MCRCSTPAAAPATYWAWRTKPIRRARWLTSARKSPPRRNVMLNSVRSRLTLWYAAFLTCTLLLLSLVIYWIVKRSGMGPTDAGLVELSDSFLATLEAELNDAPISEG